MEKVYEDIANSYPNNVLKEFEYTELATAALSLMNQELTDIFNFLEPAFFEKKIVLVKNLLDEPILPEENGENLKINKALLFNISNDVVIQVFSNKNVVMWENNNFEHIYNSNNNIIYEYNANKEKIIANHKVIDITICSSGSRFSSEFNELEKQLRNYKVHKAKYSSCPLLNKSWSSDKRILFIGGEKDVPEKFLQESLHNFIEDLKIIKGQIGQFEPTREHNLGASKPVDLVVRWEKSNRIALIEIKWLGKSVFKGKIKSNHNNSRANDGYKQLKEYFDLAKRDYPNKIIKCYLLVIDGRRWHTNEKTTTISNKNGMYYNHREISLDIDKQYHLTYKNFEEPIRMFVEPICD